MAGGVWAPYKELASTVNAAVLDRDESVHYSLDAILTKHKPDFISLLRNPVKNATHRQQVLKAVKEGLSLPTLPNLHTLPQDFIDEALILSDILSLNELSAVELMVAGEQQLPRFPNLTRGLVAVLLYYDGRRSLVSALRTLIQAREGVSWTLDLPPRTSHFITAYTDDLLKAGLVDRILSLLNTITVETELDQLSKGRAVGDPKHRAKIVYFVEEIRSCLADCLLYWAVQNPLSEENTIKLIRHLATVTVETPAVREAKQVSPKQGVHRFSSVGVTECVLIHALLACFNIGEITPESAVDESFLDERYPALSRIFVPNVHAELLKGQKLWKTPELYSAIMFAWAVLLRECSSRASFAGVDELESDGSLVDHHIGPGLQFIRQSLMTCQHFHEEEHQVRIIHHLTTSFIVNFPLKIKELRNQGDEVARELFIHGMNSDLVPVGKRTFEEMMKLVGDLYSHDPNELQLSLEFWSPEAGPAHQTPGLHHRFPQRQISLYKFISTCTDLLPAPLFPALMHMLVGLASSTHSAHHTFNLLKANSPSQGGGGASAAISLEHFFSALKEYYRALKKEGGARVPPTGSLITPLELEGLCGLLSLIRVIAKHDENARVVMYENQSWLPVASLFGLVGCPVPRELKADILHTLAVFALTPEIAASMWHTLEVSQILSTTKTKLTSHSAVAFSHHGNQDGGIQVELDELESQLEEYSFTRAFLTLLNSLMSVPPSSNLGAGHRVPGFDPYLEFVRDSVFLKFDSRGYRRAEEKWEVASLALETLHKILLSHDVTAEDFIDQYYNTPEMGGAMVPKRPGHTLLLHMLNDSKLLRKIRSVIDESFQQLSDPSTPPSDHLAHTALLSLRMLETAFSKEPEFLDHLRRSQDVGLSVSPLHELLSGINPRTAKADYIVTISRYVTLTDSSPELALTAVQILMWVCQSPAAGSKAVTHIISDQLACSEILQGFVEHLENDSEAPVPTEEAEGSLSVAGVHQAVKIGILRLLSLCVDNPSPNITHLLLGYETGIEKTVAESTLQDPGVMGAPRTCLHSILSLLEHGPDTGCHYSSPKVAELCYKIIYQLCASRYLSTPTLRYLRSNHDFFFSQLSKLPLNFSYLREEGDEDMGEVLSSQQVALLHEEAWFIKTLAIELRMTTLNHQRSHTQRIINLLLNEPTNENTDSDHMTDYGDQRSDFDYLQEKKRKILILLDSVDFSQKAAPTLELQFFDQSAIEEAIKSCELKDEVSGVGYTDVKTLHRLLMSELNSLQGAGAAGQRQSVLEEIHEILAVVVARNRVVECNHGNSELFESWRQLVEVSLHSLGQVGVKRELKVAILFELVQDLLLKVSSDDSSELTSSVHGVILMLLSHLRQTLTTPTDSQTDVSGRLSSLYTGPLHTILRGLADNLLRSSSTNQKVRAYLCGALLYYLVLTRRERESGGKGASLWRVDREEDALSSGNLTELSSFGEPFMDMVCKNACSWHAVTRMLSLSLLDAIVALDWQDAWLQFLSAKGYLQNLCASVQWEDEDLVKMTTPTPEALRALYVYESKMAFLTRVAKDPYGGRELISLNAVNYLSECKFLDNRPSYHDNLPAGRRYRGEEFVPSVGDRYRQAFLPLLKFLLALLTSPGAHHREACAQVTDLIGSHSDIFVTILKEQHQIVTMAALQELTLVTAVIGRSNVGHDWSSQLTTPIGSGLIRIQRLMLTLLPQFWSKQSWSQLVDRVVRSEGGDAVRGGEVDIMIKEEAMLLVQQIATNLVSYCRVAMTIGGTELSSPYCRLLLTPHLAEAIPMPSSRPAFAPTSTSPHSLGLLIQHLKECVEGYTVAMEAHQGKSKKLEGGTLGTEDVRMLLPVNVSVDKLTSSQQQVIAKQRLKQLVTNRKQELHQYAYLIENLLYLMWRHLQYYLVHCKPLTSDPQLVGGAQTRMRRLHDFTASQSDDTNFDLSSLGEGVSAGDLEQLKTDVGKCLTDNLFKKLLDIEEAQFQAKSEMRVGFVQALVRRVRRLLKLKTDSRPTL